MDMRLEVIGIPVSDVDAAKAFYVDQVGFGFDHEVSPVPGMRVVQMTPPGSACSVVIGEGLPLGEPGTAKGAQLVVDDLDAARSALDRPRRGGQRRHAVRSRGGPGLALRVLRGSRRERLVASGDPARLTRVPRSARVIRRITRSRRRGEHPLHPVMIRYSRPYFRLSAPTAPSDGASTAATAVDDGRIVGHDPLPAAWP